MLSCGHPSSGEGNKQYLLHILLVNLLGIFFVVFLLIGSFSPSTGLAMGNFVNVHGKVGQIMSLMGGVIIILRPYFRVRFLAIKRAPYINDLISYDLGPTISLTGLV